MSDAVRLARQIADDRLAALADSIDRDQVFSEALWREVFDFGLPGIPFAASLGGAGGSYSQYCEVVETFARRAAITTPYHAPAVLVASALANFAPARAAEVVPAILAGERKACWAFTEPQTGSDPKQITTRAQRVGNEWVLHGEKTFITLASLAEVALVFARTDDDRLSVILVDTHQPGWQPGPPMEFMAFGGAATGPVFLDGVVAPLDALVGELGQGFDILLEVEAAGKIRASATCVGIAQGAQELAVEYARQRTHRGESIGAKFPTIQSLLGDIGSSVDAARALTREAARRHDSGADVQRIAAAARIVSARAAREVTSNALQVFGSYGVVRGSTIERLYREGKFFEVGQGVVELQRLIVARSLLASDPDHPDE
jgi:alkylation response protein AidB-like acyl-CoA dehydrogenase